MHSDPSSQNPLPEPKIQTFNGFKAQITESLILPSDGFTNRYDPDGQYIAIGGSTGDKCLYSLKDDKMEVQIDDPSEIPVTCMKWRPAHNSKVKILGVGGAEGHFQYWHVPSMKKLFTIEEKENSIMCCDFSKNAEYLATAGKDRAIRIYDQGKFSVIAETKTVSVKLVGEEWDSKGHSNRIFSARFYNENTIVSGGWDSVIRIWDIRQGKTVNQFYGPHVSGDSIDFQDNQILVGCYSTKNQIQLWDIRNQKQLQAIDWICGPDQVGYVYSCCFSPFDKSAIIAGACGVNEVRIFTGQNKHTTAVRIYDLKHGCYCVDGSYSKKEIAFSSSKQGFYLCKYDSK